MTSANSPKNQGFTLIESIIYIALFGLIVGGTLTTVFQLLQGSASLNDKVSTQDEASFVLRKINWALSSAVSVSVPSLSELRVIRNDGVQVDICLDSSDQLKKVVKMRKGSVGTFACTESSFLALTTGNVSVSALQFQSVGLNPPGVISNMIISGRDFAVTKYLRP